MFDRCRILSHLFVASALTIMMMMPTSIIAFSVKNTIAKAPRVFRSTPVTASLSRFSRSQTPTILSWATCTKSSSRSSFRLFSSSSDSRSDKKRVVFLGTPDVAATTLQAIYDDSLREDSGYEVVGVVTQPPKRRGRKKDKLEPSPVAVIAEELGIPAMWPDKVSQTIQSEFFCCLLVLMSHFHTNVTLPLTQSTGKKQGFLG